MAWNNVGESYGIADYSVTFNDIDKMEEKRTNFNMEADAIHQATVKQWDVLYEALEAIAEKYKDSKAFKDSLLYKRHFDRAVPMDKKEG